MKVFKVGAYPQLVWYVLSRLESLIPLGQDTIPSQVNSPPVPIAAGWTEAMQIICPQTGHSNFLTSSDHSGGLNKRLLGYWPNAYMSDHWVIHDVLHKLMVAVLNSHTCWKYIYIYQGMQNQNQKKTRIGCGCNISGYLFFCHVYRFLKMLTFDVS